MDKAVRGDGRCLSGLYNSENEEAGRQTDVDQDKDKEKNKEICRSYCTERDYTYYCLMGKATVQLMQITPKIIDI